MIYDTGDTHAIQTKYMEQIHPHLKAGDYLIVNGDFGIGFWDGRYYPEEMFYDFIAEQPYTLLFVDGNHENFDKLNAYPVELWNGGRVHKIRPNLIHLMRGEVYEIEGLKIFAFGGGYSMDKYRRTPYVSWWPQEMPTAEEYENALKNLEKVNHQVDYIITHTAPQETVYYLSMRRHLGIKGEVYEERSLTSFLDLIQSQVKYKNWYFGHFHVDMELWRCQTAVMNALIELKSGEIVRSWDVYE